MTAAERIEVQFGKWIRKFPLPQCTVLSKEAVARIVREGLDEPVVRITAKGGIRMDLTPSAIAIDGLVVPFEQLIGYHWIDAEHQVKVRDKQDHFDRIVIMSRSGEVTVDGLGQAVFPLMKALDAILRDRRK